MVSRISHSKSVVVVLLGTIASLLNAMSMISCVTSTTVRNSSCSKSVKRRISTDNHFPQRCKGIDPQQMLAKSLI